MSGKRVIIMGATGMVGGDALGICLDNPDVSMVTVVGRRHTEVKHSGLRQVLHNNFMNYTAVSDALKHQDVVLYCLGAYSGSVPNDAFRRITFDYTLAFATALFKESPGATFCFLSGQGADQAEQSRMAFARFKGAAEKALLAFNFPRVHIFRPGYIYPVMPRKEPNLVYRVTRMLYPVVRRVYPNIGIPSEDLARAMVYAGLHGTGKHENPVLENRDIRFLEHQ